MKRSQIVKKIQVYINAHRKDMHEMEYLRKSEFKQGVVCGLRQARDIIKKIPAWRFCK